MSSGQHHDVDRKSGATEVSNAGRKIMRSSTILARYMPRKSRRSTNCQDVGYGLLTEREKVLWGHLIAHEDLLYSRPRHVI